MAISGVGDEERAKFYLEAANWELSLALSGFFEGGGSQVRRCLFNEEMCVCVYVCVHVCVCVYVWVWVFVCICLCAL